MRLDYTLSESDFSAYLDHRGRHSIYSRTLNRFLQQTGGVFIVAMIVLAGYYDLIDLIFFILCGIMLFFLLPVFVAKADKAMARQLIRESGVNEFIGERCLALTNDGLEELSGGIRQYNPYEKIYAVSEDKNHFFVYYEALNAAIVPQTAFRDESQKEAFRELLKSKRPDLFPG